jgi:uroporphyrinogen decarboxylase
MESIENSLFMRAIQCKPCLRPPVWIMRQAGRYLPEYREIRGRQKDFMSLCKNPELASEIAMQPIKRFELDAAILFSDILTIPDAMHMGLYFDNDGPKFKKRLESISDIKSLRKVDVKRDFNFIVEIISLMREKLGERKIPIIGFAAAPWTLAAYMIEGKSSKNLNRIRKLMYSNPETINYINALLTEITIEYLLLQIEAGAEAIMLFDTYANYLTKHNYGEYSLGSVSKIIAAIKDINPNVPCILFPKGMGHCIEEICETNIDAISLDWTCDLHEIRNKLKGKKIALQGNLDPAFLYGSHAEIKKATDNLVRSHPEPGLIVNLGHGVFPDTPTQSVECMVNAVKMFG